MTDYGHDLEFGTFLTPTSTDPHEPVRLARLSEEVGLDLVTFQDHPYQPAFLDTWTLLAWVAARTERVRLAPNVLNLPLRPPAVVARATASLDRLSGGRFALGIGAGAFWDAIEAMGGRRLEPGDAVTALGEAIEVIHGLWDTGQSGVLRAGGEFYHVAGAKRGPAPAHGVPVWIGAYRPRMLRLVGTVADGWLPSLGRVGPGDLARGNAMVDDAALAAGRRPGDVRRLLNVGRLDGPRGASVERLAGLAVEDGFSVFVLASDDPREIREFGEEIAPAVREAVAGQRG